MERLFSSSLSLVRTGIRTGYSSGRCLIAGEKKIKESRSNRTFHQTSYLRDIYNVQDMTDFEKRVLQSKTPVLVDFHAEWCAPCKVLGPRLESVIAPYGDKVHLAKVDVDCHTDLALEYEVTAVPAVVVIKDGQVVDRFFGLQENDQIQNFVDKVVGPDVIPNKAEQKKDS